MALSISAVTRIFLYNGMQLMPLLNLEWVGLAGQGRA